MPPEFVILGNDAGKPKRRLRVIGARKDGRWWATLPLGGGPKIACEADTLDEAIEGAAEMAARLESDDPRHPGAPPRRIPRIRSFEDLERVLETPRPETPRSGVTWEAEFVIGEDSPGKETE